MHSAIHFHNLSSPKVVREEGGIYSGWHEDHTKVGEGPHHVTHHHKQEVSLWREEMIKSTMVQVMAWCHQATSHYLNQYRSRPDAKWHR